MIKETLTMIPGPTPVHPRILDALARPTVSHVAPSFVETYRACLQNLKAIFETKSAEMFVVAGGGTLAMEMALVNLVAPGEKVLIISQGYFGDRFAQLAESFGFGFELLQAEWGLGVRPEALEERLRADSYAAVTITHVDTSTGTCAPVEDYCALLRGREELVILDGVCASGGMPEPFDRLGLDVLLTAPQKALGAPPGLAIVAFSQQAMNKRKAMQRVPAFYADIMRWLPIMQDPGRYYSTPCVNEITAMREATEIVLEEGLERRYRRHKQIAAAFRAGLGTMGLKTFTSAEFLADTLSVVRYPEGIEDAAFRKALAAEGIVVAGGLGPTAGKVFRLGHMGNIGTGEVCRTLEVIEKTLIGLGVKTETGRAPAAAAPHFYW
jgi:alanine-glyoxylate transaminase/serine-glyoxylate transaminase/serine-pyruvate transaminase